MQRAPHVVFVDDSLDDVEIACWRLAKAGIEIDTIRLCSQSELTNELTQYRPALIISDFSMPRFDGWSALQVSQSLAPTAPFIFHSGTIGAERCRIALTRGAFGCVEKEYPAQFVELVKKALTLPLQP
jgi:two-component system, NtrC family, sensor kinase